MSDALVPCTLNGKEMPEPSEPCGARTKSILANIMCFCPECTAVLGRTREYGERKNLVQSRSPAPSVGRIVHYMLETRSGVSIRPAIIVRVGPARIEDKDIDQVLLSVFTDIYDVDTNGRTMDPMVWRHAVQAPENEFKAGTWRWPTRS
jgi:hypothetical protein